MTSTTIKINRAPVLTLWATVVAERLGYDHDAALTLGKAVAGLNAQSKGRRLGIFEESGGETAAGKPGPRARAERQAIPLLGRAVPAQQTVRGIRATDKGQPIDPQSVQRYLERKFGPALPAAQAAMEALARAYEPGELAVQAYPLYEKFRPQIPAGTKGWGAAGELDLDRIRALAGLTDR